LREDEDDQMRFGLIGTGYWAAAVHAPGIVSQPGTELAAVWGRDPAKAERLAAQFGPKAFSEVDELIAAVDAVAFSVPPDVQAELAVRAGAADRPLLLEKPLALTVEAADRVVEAVSAPTVVFFTRRFDPGVRSWFDTEVDGHAWDGRSVTMLFSIFDPGIRSASHRGEGSAARSRTSARTRLPSCSRRWDRSRRSRWCLGCGTRCISACVTGAAPPAA
jgi:Oxidoreductase family, NAD-binding Rossmann fold